MPDLERNLWNGLTAEKQLRVSEVGQCYEGGKDGFSVSFESISPDHTVDVLKRAWTCDDVREDQEAGENYMSCDVADSVVEFEIETSIGRGSAYASLSSTG